MLLNRLIVICSVAIMLPACVSRKTSATTKEDAIEIGGLKYLDHYTIAHNQSFQGTTIGGLSGLDYDPKNDWFYLISDDRSAFNPVRFYTAKLAISKDKIDSIQWLSVQYILQPSGKTYPSSKEDQRLSPDPEAIRLNRSTGNLVWTSEGERILDKTDTVLTNPAILTINKAGKYLDSFPLPANLTIHPTENGPRRNGALEGLSFSRDNKTIFVNVEEPLYEDGPRADLQPNQAWIRIYQFDLKSQKNTAQYAYLLDPIAYPSIPNSAFKINGVPDLLAIGKNQLLVMERSFSSGRIPCTIKIFQVDLSQATDISNNPSLSKSSPAKPATKKLLLNLDSLAVPIDNLEGMSFGPTLPNGHKTLVMVTDNNFQAIQKTQFFLFEIIPQK